MTESEWTNATDPRPMLEILKGKASDRKCRLFVCACARRVWSFLTDPLREETVEAAERLAEGAGAASGEVLSVAGRNGSRLTLYSQDLTTHQTAWSAAWSLAYWAAYAAAQEADEDAWRYWYPDLWRPEHSPAYKPAEAAEHLALAGLLRDIFNPFRSPPAINQEWVAWNGGLVRRLAKAAYDNRQLPSGHLETDRLLVLADALEDAAADAEVLSHLRAPGPKVRGDWVIDLLLDLE